MLQNTFHFVCRHYEGSCSEISVIRLVMPVGFASGLLHYYAGVWTRIYLLGQSACPGSCGEKSREFGRSFERSLTGSEIRKVLCRVTQDMTEDHTKEIRAKWDLLIPPQGSPMTIRASSHRIQANHLVAGLTHTLGAVRSLSMPAVMVSNSSSAASARVAIAVAIALQSMNTSEASRCQLRERSAV